MEKHETDPIYEPGTPLAIAHDILDNRRKDEICDRDECFYPTLPILAQAVIDLEEEAKRWEDRYYNELLEEIGGVWPR